MTVLRGALLVDGTGAPPRPADVVLEADRIAAVEAPGTASGSGDVVDLDGLVLAPGFIDCHTHYDAQVLWDPDLTPSSWHGVTTVVMGNCGFGIAPTRPAGRETIARTLENVEGMSVEALFAGIPWTFETFPEYLDAVERAAPKLNVAVMLGHTPLRLYVLGEEAAERDATSAEIEEMRRLVADALDAGAIGFASSRQPAHAGAWGKPVPSRLATTDELMRLAEPLAERGRGTFAITHGPDFGPVELAELSVKTGRPVTWTALNASPAPSACWTRLRPAAARSGPRSRAARSSSRSPWPSRRRSPAPTRSPRCCQFLLPNGPGSTGTRPGGSGPGRTWPGSGTTAGTRYSWPRRWRTPSWPTGPRSRSWPPSAASTRSTCCATSPSTMTWRPASGSWSPTTMPPRSPDCSGTTAPCSACPTRARTPASSATRSSPLTCWSTGSGRPARCPWRRPSGGSPGTPRRCSGSPAGAGSPPGTSPTWSRSTPPPSGWSGWSGCMTCPRAPTGLSPAATVCTRSGSTAHWPMTATATASRGQAA